MLTGREVAVLDRNAEAVGVPRKQLMESSGNAVARAVRELAGEGSRVTVVAGRGNNGGDALVAARFLDDYDVTVHLLGRPAAIRTRIARENWDALVAADIPRTVVTDSRTVDLGDPDVIVDALLGTGVSGELREPVRTAAKRINDSSATVLSVDVPSGLDADTGERPPHCVEADRVVTFHDTKPGLEGLSVTVADIGIPEAAERFVGPGDLLRLDRPAASHKGDFGRVTVIGGGPYTGAPALAGLAALRTGADLAYIAVPHAIADPVRAYSPDLIVEPYEGNQLHPDVVDRLLASVSDRDVVVLGPGLGGAEPTLAAVHTFLSAYDGRAVVDADALSVVGDVDTSATLVCTPHRGELQDMGGPRVWDAREDAPAVADFAQTLGHTLLVKGPVDVITDGETTRLNRTGTSAMTVGGTGDVLAGITGALLAVQPPKHAAAIGAYLNGAAGERAIEEGGFGLLASDLPDELPAILSAD